MVVSEVLDTSNDPLSSDVEFAAASPNPAVDESVDEDMVGLQPARNKQPSRS